MSVEKKAEKFDLAISLLIECRNYIEKTWIETPGRLKLLNKMDQFEKILADDFSKGG